MRKTAVAIIAGALCAGAAGAEPADGPSGSWAGTAQFTRGAGLDPFAMSVELRGRRAVVSTCARTRRPHRSRGAHLARPDSHHGPRPARGRSRSTGVCGRVLAGTLRQGPLRGRFRLQRRAPLEGAAIGLYRFGDGRPLALLQAIGPPLSLLYDEGEIRALYQTGRGRYAVGAGLATRNPSVGTATFAAAGAVFRGAPAARVALRQEEVWVRSGRVYLGCTLTIPPGPGKRPALTFAQAPARRRAPTTRSSACTRTTSGS